MINGVIFDLDGTIWDSIHFRIDSWKKAFKDYGLDADPEIIQLMIGYPGSMLIKKMKMKDPNIEMLEEKYYNEHLNEVKFFPDVENTFKELRKRDIKIGIVTSSRREMINKINLNVDAIVTMDDIKNGKPDIEPYMKATDIMKIKPENTMVVGDIDNDLIPSKILNCVSILVTHGIKKESEHKDYEIKEIHEILKIIDEKNL